MGGFDLQSWVKPQKIIPALFSKDTAFGIDIPNATGVDKDRSMGTAPGTRDIRISEDVAAAAAAAPAAAIPQTAAETAAETVSKAEATAQAANTTRLKSQKRSRSIYSSPLGLAGEAATVTKQLLGQ